MLASLVFVLHFHSLETRETGSPGDHSNSLRMHFQASREMGKKRRIFAPHYKSDRRETAD